ncbi:MAG: hypothetical protein WCL11_19895 [Verrucomicrobiota bacterium]
MTQVGYKRLSIGLGAACALLLVYTACLHIAETYASKEVRGLQKWRDMALQSEIPKAAEVLGWLSRDRPSGNGAALEQIRSIQWTNATRDIINHLRAKTGEDLGADPQPWVERYGPKQQHPG